MPKACSDRHPQTADAGVHDGMGDLLVWSLRAGRKQSGADGVYVEALAETCTESGSGLWE
ncbi:MAG: hypothetical protein E7Z72_01880 [Methanocorpusculum parvum]|nr:hypothetical protein [Methanocorpusculum parvum]